MPFSIDPSDIQTIGIGCASFLATVITVAVMITQYHDRATRHFGYIAAMVSVWAWAGFFYQITDVLWIARNFRVISMGGIIGIAFTSANFAFEYLRIKRSLRKKERMLQRLMQGGAILLLLLLAFDLYQTKLFVGPLLASPTSTLAPSAGPLLFVLIAYYAVAIVVLVFILRRRIAEDAIGSEQTQTRILLWSGALAMFFGAARFAPWYGYNLSPILAAIAVPILAIGVFYGVKHYKLFNVKIALAELFVFLLWTFSFFRILLNPSISDALLDIVIFLAQIILGIFLIRSILKEIESREALEVLSKELKDLNENLEERVVERTKELRQTGEHVEQIVENLPVGLVEVVVGGDIVRMNRAAEALLDRKRTQVVGKKIPSGKKDVLARIFAQSVTSIGDAPENTASGVFDIEMQKPEYRELNVSFLPIVTEKGKHGRLFLLRDVTQERVIDRAKSEFVSIAAHQMRTPVTGLRWIFDHLLSGNSGKVTNEQRSLYQRGLITTANMLRITNDFLNVAQVSKGKFTYAFTKGDVGRVVEKVAEGFAMIAEDEKLTYAVHIDSDLPAIQFDEEKLAQAMQNIIDNAIKYTEPGGKVDVGVHKSASGVAIKIADTGIGISAKDQRRLFEQFFRSERALKTFTDGSGLGLFITKTIIEDHGGKIEVDSEQGKGTTFTLSLPKHMSAKA